MNELMTFSEAIMVGKICDFFQISSDLLKFVLPELRGKFHLDFSGRKKG